VRHRGVFHMCHNILYILTKTHFHSSLCGGDQVQIGERFETLAPLSASEAVRRRLTQIVLVNRG